MVYCIFSIPISAWVLQDGIFAPSNMEKSALCYGEDSTVFVEFKQNLIKSLNSISSRNADNVGLWMCKVDWKEVKIAFYTSNENLTLPQAIDLFWEEAFPAIDKLEASGYNLGFDKSKFDKHNVIMQLISI